VVGVHSLLPLERDVAVFSALADADAKGPFF
jgi:hypothetical protein